MNRSYIYLKWHWSHILFRLFGFLTLSIALVALTVEKGAAQATVDSLRVPTLTKPQSTDTNDSFPKTTTIVTQNPSLKKSKPLTQIDSTVEKAYSRAMEAYYYALERKNISDAAAFDSLASYNNWALKNRKKVIEKQQINAKIIFVLVIAIVLSGLVFSALQFRNAMKNSKKKGAVSDTTVKATLAGIEISSSILGVIILTLSIVFFYLYLTMVYPVVLVN